MHRSTQLQLDLMGDEELKESGCLGAWVRTLIAEVGFIFVRLVGFLGFLGCCLIHPASQVVFRW